MVCLSILLFACLSILTVGWRNLFMIDKVDIGLNAAIHPYWLFKNQYANHEPREV